MIIYKCVICEDEMFSDIYPIKEVCNGVCIEIDGKTIARREGDIDESLIGGNASAECCVDDVDPSITLSGIDIVMNHKLQETPFSKDAFKLYIKGYMKAIKSHLEKTNPGRVQPFMTGAAEKIKEILGNFKNLQFFTGESMDPDGTVGFLDYREDGITPFMTFFLDGLRLEKC